MFLVRARMEMFKGVRSEEPPGPAHSVYCILFLLMERTLVSEKDRTSGVLLDDPPERTHTGSITNLNF